MRQECMCANPDQTTVNRLKLKYQMVWRREIIWQTYLGHDPGNPFETILTDFPKV